MRTRIPILLAWCTTTAIGSMSGPYSPHAGIAGSTAVPWVENDYDPRVIGWATGVSSFTAGPMCNQYPNGPRADWGLPADALGASDGELNDGFSVVSLGDGGQITLTFAQPFGNGPGPDLAVFENAFKYSEDTDLAFLELAFVEVSSDGLNFHRFPSISLTQTDAQIGAFGTLDTTNIHNLAGKFETGYGTPFDLSDLAASPTLDINAITHVRILDIVGSVNPLYGRLDSRGILINDPWLSSYDPEDPPDYYTGGFDLDAVAVMSIPEPATSALCLLGMAISASRRKRAS